MRRASSNAQFLKSVLTGVSLALVSHSACAGTTYSWNFTSTGYSAANGGCVTSGAVAAFAGSGNCGNTLSTSSKYPNTRVFESKDASDGSALQVRVQALFTDKTGGTTITPNPTTPNPNLYGHLRSYNGSTANYAGIGVYSGGLGVSNPIDNQDTTNGDKTQTNKQENSNDGQHAVDNKRVDGINSVADFILLEFESFIDLSSFQIGWQDVNPGTDVDIWIAPNNLSVPTDFSDNNICAQGCVGAGFQNLVGAGGLGFQKVSLTNIGTTPQTITGVDSSHNKSKYVLVSGLLGGTNDAFKINTIAATTSVPEPGTLALLTLGMLGLAFVGRRRTS